MRLAISVAVTSLILALMLLSCTCLADKGVILFEPYSIEEPRQVAIIAWNNGVEVLILSNDLKASGLEKGNVSALEILPLPSKPIVEEGDWRAFGKISSYVLSKSVYKGYAEVGVILHERIGPHDIYVLKVNDAVDLVNWINQYAEEKGFSLSKDTEDLEFVVQSYVDNGYCYFVIDRVEISFSEIKTVNPLVYTFNSSLIYYPMMITTVGYSDWANVDLFIVTKDRIKFEDVEGFKVYQQVKLSYDQLKNVDYRVAELIGGGGWVTLLEFSGDLTSASDLMVQPELELEIAKMAYLAMPPIFAIAIAVYLFSKDLKLAQINKTRDKRLLVASLLLALIGTSTMLPALKTAEVVMEGVLPVKLEELLALIAGISFCIAILSLSSAILLAVYSSKRGGFLGIVSSLAGVLSSLGLAIFIFTPFHFAPAESLIFVLWSFALVGLAMFIPEIICLVLIGLGWDSLR